MDRDSRTFMTRRYGAADIAEKYQQDARSIVAHYRALPDFTELVVVFLEVGGIFPAVDLSRGVAAVDGTFPVTLYPLYASRYGDAMAGAESVQIIETRAIPRGAHVLLVDDIIDRGDTLQACVDYLLQRSPKSVLCYTHTIREGCQVPANVTLICQPLPLGPGEWGVGHGMSDDQGYHRAMTDIGTLPAPV